MEGGGGGKRGSSEETAVAATVVVSAIAEVFLLLCADNLARYFGYRMDDIVKDLADDESGGYGRQRRQSGFLEPLLYGLYGGRGARGEPLQLMVRSEKDTIRPREEAYQSRRLSGRSCRCIRPGSKVAGVRRTLYLSLPPAGGIAVEDADDIVALEAQFVRVPPFEVVQSAAAEDRRRRLRGRV